MKNQFNLKYIHKYNNKSNVKIVRKVGWCSWKISKVKLTKSQLKEMIKEILEEDMAPGLGYSSKEAKTVVEQGIEEYAKILRKAQYKIIKDWMSKAKAGVIDYFDLVRGLETGDAARAHSYETQFFKDLLNRDKIIARFRKYFGGKKGMRGRK